MHFPEDKKEKMLFNLLDKASPSQTLKTEKESKANYMHEQRCKNA